MLIYLQLIDTIEDKHKFEVMYNTYKKSMLAIALRILRNQQDAEDVVHTTFITLAKNMDRIGDVDDVKTKGFILTITRNKAIDMYRRNQRKKDFELKEYDEDMNLDHNWSNTLSNCFSRLPDTYRTFLLLKYYHGYSTKEVANILGISCANASKIDQRAKQKLHDLYNQ